MIEENSNIQIYKNYFFKLREKFAKKKKSYKIFSGKKR